MPNGNKIIRYRWSVKLRDINGISRRKQITSSKSKADLKEKVKLFLKDYEERKAGFFEKLTLSQLCDLFLKDVKTTVKPRTYQYYEYVVRCHLSKCVLAGTRIKNITPKMMQDYFFSLQNQPLANGTGKILQSGTINSLRNSTKVIFNYAVKMGYCLTNVIEHTRRIKMEPKKPLTLSKEQIRHLLDIAFNDKEYVYLDVAQSQKENKPVYVSKNYWWEEDIGMQYLRKQTAIIVLLAIRSIARRGEVCGAKWDDFDFEKKTFLVSRTLQDGAHGVLIGSPKTGHFRKILLDSDTVEKLKEWKRYQEEYAQKLGSKFEKTGFCFTNSFGKYLDLSNFRSNYWQKLCIRAGIQGTRFHDLRHYGASLLLASGVPVSCVQERGGWSTPNILLSTYAFNIPGVQELAVKVIESQI